MYYSHKCPYCGKVFYTFNDSKEQAAQILFTGIKKHLIDYNEDHKEFEFDEYFEKEVNQMYAEIVASSQRPEGGYELE